MIIDEKDFWEKLEDYDSNIASVFAVENELTELIGKIKNKDKKTIMDLGCGIGNSFKTLKDFKKIYAVDFSKNMLNQARKNNKLKNVEFINGDLYTIKNEPADILLSISSLMPQNLNDFYTGINNFILNTKRNGKIILVLPSYESITHLIHIKSDFIFKKYGDANKSMEVYRNEQQRLNYNAQGYIITNHKRLIKHWLKEELQFRLNEFKFKKITIRKLKLDWEKQSNAKIYSNYPELWFWLIEIKK